MRLEKCAIIGLGQGGNNVADFMYGTAMEAKVLYVNSSFGDTENLKFVNDENRRIFKYSDGVGKDQDKALRLFMDSEKEMEIFLDNQLIDRDYVIVVSSLAGGTGSGIVTEFCALIKDIYPEIGIGVIGLVPGSNETLEGLENASRTLREMGTEKFLNNVDNFIFVNNDKFEGNLGTINVELIKDMLEALQLTSESRIDRIDNADLDKVFLKANGYLTILNLPETCETTEDAFIAAKEKSVFAFPDDYNCEYGVAVVGPGYTKESIKVLCPASRGLTISHDRTGVNKIVLGGCSYPRAILKDIEDKIALLKNKTVAIKKTLDVASEDRAARLRNEDRRSSRTKSSRSSSRKVEIDTSTMDWDMF